MPAISIHLFAGMARSYAKNQDLIMCELYVKAAPILYESRSRSLRIRGVVTTLRLENQFWDLLA